jgi:adenosylhomocysteine nucleosidase
VGHVTILIATGLRREARLMAGPGVTVIAGGGDAARLERDLDALAGSATAILSSGLAGALDPELRIGDVVIGGEQPGTASLRASIALRHKLGSLVQEAHAGLVLGSDTPIANAGEKAALHRTIGALAADMESHVAARVAARHSLPFAAVRVISDAADATLPPAALVGMRPDGGIAIGAILASLARNPGQIPALIRTARDAEKAFGALGRLHDMLRGFGIGRLDPRQLALDMR